MRISIQQPEHLPWLGFFDKVRQVDLVVLHDNCQFKRYYFENRNKIRTNSGWQWVGIPALSRGRYQDICEVEIDNLQLWRGVAWRAIRHNYFKAAYWEEYSSFFEDIYRCEWIKLADFNVGVIRYIAKQLGLQTEFIIASQLGVMGKAGEALISICQKVGANSYLSGAFGRDYIDESLFTEAGIALEYQDFHHPIYHQVYQPFLPNMSTIDLLFNEGPKSLAIIEGANKGVGLVGAK